MPRIHTAAVRTQVLATSLRDELAVAAGSNGASSYGNNLLSRTEQGALAADMQSAAEEARARRPGVAPTIDQVNAVVAERVDAAFASVNQPSGSGKAFLSKAEVQNLLARDPLMGGRVQRAIDVLATPAPTPSPRLTAAEIETQLKAHTGSLTFDGLLGSEGGESIDAVRIATRLPSTPPTGPDLARAFGHDPSTDAGLVERYRKPEASLLADIQSSNGDTPDAKKVVELLRGLAELRVLVIGKDGGANVDANHPTYIVGVAADGQVVGIKTGVIWT